MSALLQAQNGANPATIAHAQGNCAGCGRTLTAEEAHYYGSSCEACERRQFEDGERAEAGLPPVIRLVLGYPISANRYWAHRIVKVKGSNRQMAITYETPEAKAYKQEVQRLALLAGVRKPLQGRVQLTVRLFPNRPQDWAKRARKDPDGWADTVQCIDLGNCEKVLSDALNGVAWTDDKQLHEIRLQRMDPDERGPRVEVEIAPIVHQAIAPDMFGGAP